jgi:hypothetical protein
MIIGGIERYDELARIKLNDHQLEELLIELMKLFISYPQSGMLVKLKKLIGVEKVVSITMKQFSTLLTNMFPLISKHITNYVTSKFRDMLKNGRLLKHFSSSIIKDEAVILALKKLEITGAEVQKLYSNEEHGNNFFVI